MFSFAVDMGSVNPGDHPDPVVWTIGLIRNPLIAYSAGGSVQDRSAYYRLNYSSDGEAVHTAITRMNNKHWQFFAQASGFLNDFEDALSRSWTFDNKVLSAASSISPEYAGILSLVTRQIFASMDITVPLAKSGQLNGSDVKIFMKDIGQSLWVPIPLLVRLRTEACTQTGERILLKSSMAHSRLSFSSIHH